MRRTRARRWLWLLPLACAPFLLTHTGSAQQAQVGNVVGEILVARLGFPPKQIMVSLQTRGATVSSAYTDGQGRFGFYSIPSGLYYIVIQDEDYLPVSQEVKLDLSISTVSYANVTLNLRAPAKSDLSAGRVAGSNPNVIDLSEYTRKFPKKAVKEYERGLDANRDSNKEAALRHFQKSLELAPDFYPAHNELGRMYMANSEFAQAQQQFEEAIKLNQSDAEAHLNLSNVLLLSKKYDEAQKSVEEGLRWDPHSALGKFILGSIYEHTGRPQQAERALREALQLDPKMSRVHLELVNLYLGVQKKVEASAELRTFLKDFPDDPFVPKAREVLHKLEK